MCSINTVGQGLQKAGVFSKKISISPKMSVKSSKSAENSTITAKIRVITLKLKERKG